MTLAFQESLLDVADAPQIGALGEAVHRTELSRGAWIDERPSWITGSGALFDTLTSTVPWCAEQRTMYDRLVDVPRLLCFYRSNATLPDPLLITAKSALDEHYLAELGETFSTAGLCLYRDGKDSVAWHGDDSGRGKREDTMVAILSLGSPRSLLLRPRGGGTAIRRNLGHGDLIVMGGSCQRTWEHAIPKTTKPVGPRISVQFRPYNVR